MSKSLLNPDAAKNFGTSLNGEIKSIKPEMTAENVVSQTGGVYALDLWNMDTREIPKLLGDFITKVGLMLLVGSSDAGKSMFCRDLVLSLVSGDDEFIGMPFDKDILRKAIIISTEDDDLAISYLIRQRQLSKKRFDPEKILKNLVFFFDSEDIIARVEENLKLNPVDVVLLDTLGDILNNPNDNGEIRSRLSDFKRLATNYKCLFIVMHHTSKRTEGKAPDKSSILGGASIEQKVRLALELRSDVNDLNRKHLSVLKGNYLSKEYKGASFVLEMDEETFNFNNTGERAQFDDLVIQEDSEGNKREPLLKADQVDYDIHLKVLKEVFKEGLKPKLSDLNIRLSNKYEKEFSTKFGERRVRKYLDYLMDDIGLIGKHGKDKSPNAYYYLTTDDITTDAKK